MNSGACHFICWITGWFFRTAEVPVFRIYLYKHGASEADRLLCNSISWGGWVPGSDAVLQIPPETSRHQVLEGRGAHLIQSNQQQFRHEEAEESPSSVGRWPNTEASGFSRNDLKLTSGIDKIVTNMSSSVVFKDGPSAVKMTYPGSSDSWFTFYLPRLGATGSRGRRLREALNKLPSGSQKRRRRQEAFLQKTSTPTNTTLPLWRLQSTRWCAILQAAVEHTQTIRNTAL